MSGGKIVAVHVGLIRPPRRFAVQRRIRADHDVFDVYRPHTLQAFVKQLLVVLSSTGGDFMKQVALMDDEAFQRSKHKTRRYIAESRELLYIASEHLTPQSTQVLGYWVATNVGRKEVEAVVGLACRAAGVERGSIYKLQL